MNVTLSREDKTAIKEALEARGATLPCPRCGGERFDVLDGYFFHVNQQSTQVVVPEGQGVLTAVIGCVQCGYLMQHATNLLGLTRTRCQLEAEAELPL